MKHLTFIFISLIYLFASDSNGNILNEISTSSHIVRVSMSEMVKITVEVIDNNTKLPLRGAEVRIDSKNNTYRSATDANGMIKKNFTKGDTLKVQTMFFGFKANQSVIVADSSFTYQVLMDKP
jgi:hypothetical protein